MHAHTHTHTNRAGAGCTTTTRSILQYKLMKKPKLNTYNTHKHTRRKYGCPHTDTHTPPWRFVPVQHTYCNCWYKDKNLLYWNTNRLLMLSLFYVSKENMLTHVHTNWRLCVHVCSLAAVSLLSPPPLTTSLVTAVILSGLWQPILLTDTHTHTHNSPCISSSVSPRTQKLNSER